ncbi:L,D-transpeptidase family protein [uncultured Bdellovibrio sp.]|uniref:L,D-transpeptidase family protein n=1 Tax=Bdellovibrio sp. HCB-162 TaxID=3394234 RepID=UPI0025F35EE1|nr:L,D-transpeptidase family protein [uncultured Bdellovibrio sp.]
MNTFRIIVVGVTLFFSSLGNTQSKQADYLEVIDALSLPDIRAAMLSSASHGLNYKSYWTDAMELSFQQGGNPLLKTQANENFLNLLKDISLGVVNPESMGVDVKLKQKVFLTAPQLKVLLLASGTSANPLMEGLAPKTAQYITLKEALHKLISYCSQGQWPELPPLKKDLKPGVYSPAIPALKERMRQLGYNIPSNDDIFDEDTVDAAIDIQWMSRVKPDGVISANGRTFKYLNTPCETRIQQVRLDMEKLRWFPQTFEDRYIFINLAMSQFTLIDKTGPSLFSMNFRTINGRVARKSPTLKDKIVYVVINPFWVVPPTIFKEDKVEEIRKLQPWEIAAYFQTRNYEVWNRDFTQRIDPTTIDWNAQDPNLDSEIFIRQKPNYMNALGVLKFMLTNSFAIYLHDTNQREIFSDPFRLISSGCVRLERPMDLAEYLLRGTPWTRELIERYAAKPGEVLDMDTRVALKKAMPVYMAFLTSQLSSDGVIRFAEDTYDQGSRLLKLGAW